ncbi:hypothetical protein FACS1894139_14790 [Planctomycetales bacterium]|nr:hypothetical protein FACS1894139_14790 [Planctomycetales bacterium]
MKKLITIGFAVLMALPLSVFGEEMTATILTADGTIHHGAVVELRSADNLVLPNEEATSAEIIAIEDAAPTGEKGGLYQSTGIYGFLHGDKIAEERAVQREKDKIDRFNTLQKSLLEEPSLASIDEAIGAIDQAHVDKLASGFLPKGLANLLMIFVCLVLIYLAIVKGYEPLLLLPIGFGGLLSNIPQAFIAEAGVGTLGDGFLYIIYTMGVTSGLFPLLIFMGVGAMTDFGPLIANPKTALLGGAAQLGIFATLVGAVIFGFDLKQAASIGIIGGADGPTSIFVTTQLAPDLLGAIAVAAYSYMALVPIIQPPIMRWIVPENERKIEMKQLRHVSKMEKIVFPLLVLLLCALLIPDATPLLGALMFGNLCKESGVADRLAKCMSNELINIVTILLGLSVGSKLSAEKFLTLQTLGIIILGLCAFAVATAGGLCLGRLMNWWSVKKGGEAVNPLIGSAGVSAVPMAARVTNGVGLESNPGNFLLMHAMGPNVAGVIGSAVAAGILLSQLR